MSDAPDTTPENDPADIPVTPDADPVPAEPETVAAYPNTPPPETPPDDDFAPPHKTCDCDKPADDEPL